MTYTTPLCWRRKGNTRCAHPGAGTQPSTPVRAVPLPCARPPERAGRSRDAGLLEHAATLANFQTQDRVAVCGICHQRCSLYGMQVATAGTLDHEAFKNCQQMAAAQHQHVVAAQRAVTVYVEQFKHLRRIVLFDNCDAPAVRRSTKHTHKV